MTAESLAPFFERVLAASHSVWLPPRSLPRRVQCGARAAANELRAREQDFSCDY